MRKSQSALEYLSVFAWMFIIIIIISVVFFALGVFNPTYDISKRTEMSFEAHEVGILDHRLGEDGVWFLEVINRFQIENIILASNECPAEQMDKLISQCNALGVRVFILPRLYEMFAEKMKLHPIESMPIFEIIWEPISGFNQILKRLFDILFSLTALALSLPIMLLIALLIKLTSMGPSGICSQR